MNPLNYSFELEQKVLEHIMGIADHNDVRVQKAMLKLSTECFYKPDHAELFAMVKKEFHAQQPFDFVSILVLIPKGEDALHSALTWVMDNFRTIYVGSSSFESDVSRLITLSTLRKQLMLMERACKDIREIGSPEAAQDAMIEVVNQISNLNYRESKQGVSNADLADMYYEGKIVQDLAMPTTCKQLNEALGGGVMPKSLITIAAGAGVGKTGFSIFLLDAIARMLPHTQSLFYSLEMESQHIWTRHVGICGGKLFTDMNEDEKLVAISKSMAVPIQIYDSARCRSAPDIDFIITNSRLKAMERKVSVIVVDYLGLVQNKGKFERNDLKQADITTRLANLALELDCIVIALSQINRGNAARSKDDQCPWPHDAADSSGSHRSSALWIGIDRPEQYQDDFCYKNQFVIKCRKNRFGDNFELVLAFNQGTFAEVPHGWFKKPQPMAKDATKTIFGAYGRDFSGD